MPIPTLAKAVSLFILLLALAGCSVTQAMRVSDGEIIDVDAMAAELAGAQVVFAGERHDAAAHHELQLKIIKAFQASGKPLAIGMEMFDETTQPALDAWSAGKVPVHAFRKVYQWSWRNIAWEMYSDIFFYARDNRIPIVALNAQRGIVQAVARGGFASLTPEQLAKLPAGVDASADERFQRLMRANYPSHGKSGQGFRNIAEAQLLRNVVMARRIGDYLALHPGRSMVVIAGGGHAQGTGGVPEELRQGITYKVVLPPVPPFNEESVTERDADYLLVEPFL